MPRAAGSKGQPGLGGPQRILLWYGGVSQLTPSPADVLIHCCQGYHTFILGLPIPSEQPVLG